MNTRSERKREERWAPWASDNESEAREDADRRPTVALPQEDRDLLLDLVMRLTRADNATFDNQRLAGRFVGVLCEGLRAIKGGIFTRNAEGEVVELAARQLRLDAGGGAADASIVDFSPSRIGEAFRTGKVLLGTLGALELAAPVPRSARLNMPGPSVVVPVIAPPGAPLEGRPFAALCLVRAEGDAPFDDKVALLEQLAATLAPFLHRSQLYQDAAEEAKERLREAEQRFRAVELELSTSSRNAFRDIVYASEGMARVIELAKYAAGSRSLPVLLLGESGVGKEVVSRGIHALSPRRDKPLVVRNMGASIDPTHMYADLFGAKKGTYTGQTEDRVGMFEVANGGTVMLDEIGDASEAIQTMLLRALDQQEITRMGESIPRKVDVRVIAATNKDLEELIAENKFRGDLYYRLKVIVIEIPALRDRRGDIPLLVEHFLRAYMKEEGIKQAMSFTADAMDVLKRSMWIGNVRELKGVVQAAANFARGHTKIRDMHVTMAMHRGAKKAPPIGRSRHTKESVLAALVRNRWKPKATGLELGVTRAHVYNLMRKFDIKSPDAKAPGSGTP